MTSKDKYTGNSSGQEGKKRVVLADLGGMKKVIDELTDEILLLRQPKLPRHLGISPVRGLFLHGPPGCGKTMLVNAISNEAEVPIYQISPADFLSPSSGSIEDVIGSFFRKAFCTGPSIIFMDHIDAITSNGENPKTGMEHLIIRQLIYFMDNFSHAVQGQESDFLGDKAPSFVLVISHK